MPYPDSIEPTKANAGEDCRKKNPTPIPNRTPPPIAHVLLSSLLFVITEILNIKIDNYLNLTTVLSIETVPRGSKNIIQGGDSSLEITFRTYQ